MNTNEIVAQLSDFKKERYCLNIVLNAESIRNSENKDILKKSIKEAFQEFKLKKASLNEKLDKGSPEHKQVEGLISNMEFSLLRELVNAHISWIDCIPEDYVIAKGFIDKYLKNESSLVKYLEPSLKNNENCIKSILKKNPHSFRYLTDECKNNKELASIALSSDATLLMDCGDVIKKDKELVMDLIRRTKNVFLLEMSHSSIREDVDIVKDIMTINESYYERSGNKEIRKSQEMLFYALECGVLNAISFADKEFLNDDVLIQEYTAKVSEMKELSAPYLEKFIINLGDKSFARIDGMYTKDESKIIQMLNTLRCNKTFKDIFESEVAIRDKKGTVRIVDNEDVSILKSVSAQMLGKILKEDIKNGVIKKVKALKF